MRRWWATLGRLFVLLQFLCLTTATLPPPALHVVDGHFVLALADGTALPPDALLGHEFSVAGQRLRITAIVPAPHHPAGPITLYDVSVFTPRSGPWEPYCLPDAHGRALAIPVTGTWTPDGRYVPGPGAVYPHLYGLRPRQVLAAGRLALGDHAPGRQPGALSPGLHAADAGRLLR